MGVAGIPIHRLNYLLGTLRSRRKDPMNMVMPSLLNSHHSAQSVLSLESAKEEGDTCAEMKLTS